MPTLPAAASFTGSTVTEAQFKQAITDQREYLAGLLGTSGAKAEALAALGAIISGVTAKTGAYTVVESDRGKLIDATSGTWTLTLTAAATLGAGFAFAVKNSGTGVITIDPAASEQIDGATTIGLASGESALLVCTGATWKTVGRVITPPPVNLFTTLAATPITAGTGKVFDQNPNHSGTGAWVTQAGYTFVGASGSTLNLTAKTQRASRRSLSGKIVTYSYTTGYARILINGVEVVAISTNSSSYQSVYLYSSPYMATLQHGDVITLQTLSASGFDYASGGWEVGMSENFGVGKLLFT